MAGRFDALNQAIRDNRQIYMIGTQIGYVNYCDVPKIKMICKGIQEESYEGKGLMDLKSKLSETSTLVDISTHDRISSLEGLNWTSSLEFYDVNALYRFNHNPSPVRRDDQVSPCEEIDNLTLLQEPPSMDRLAWNLVAPRATGSRNISLPQLLNYILLQSPDKSRPILIIDEGCKGNAEPNTELTRSDLGSNNSCPRDAEIFRGLAPRHAVNIPISDMDIWIMVAHSDRLHAEQSSPPASVASSGSTDGELYFSDSGSTGETDDYPVHSERFGSRDSGGGRSRSQSASRGSGRGRDSGGGRSRSQSAGVESSGRGRDSDRSRSRSQSASRSSYRDRGRDRSRSRSRRRSPRKIPHNKVRRQNKKTSTRKRKYSREYCKKTSCKQMGFSQKASCVDHIRTAIGNLQRRRALDVRGRRALDVRGRRALDVRGGGPRLKKTIQYSIYN